MSTEKSNKDQHNLDADQTPELERESQREPDLQASQVETEKPDHVSHQQTPQPASPVDPDTDSLDQQTGSAHDHTAAASQASQHIPVTDKSSRTTGIIPLLAMFILFTGAGVLLWLEQQQMGQRLQQSEQRSTDIQSRLDNSQQLQQQQASKANEELQASISTMQELVTAQQQAPRQNETELLLHQSLMLVRMAQAQIQVRHNVADAVLALQWAQQHLQTHNDVRLEPVMAQLERDIQLLQNLPEKNNLALAQQLSSLIVTVDKLPIRSAAVRSLDAIPALETQAQVPVSSPQPESENTTWRTVLQAIRKELENLVVIRRRDLPIQPLMSAERKQILHDVLRLRLEALQVQLMREAIAAQNVARARALSWLREWFDETSAGVVSLRDWLNHMPQTAIVLPDLQGSVTAITAAMGQTSSIQTDRQP